MYQSNDSYNIRDPSFVHHSEDLTDLSLWQEPHHLNEKVTLNASGFEAITDLTCGKMTRTACNQLKANKMIVMPQNHEHRNVAKKTGKENARAEKT